MKLSLNMKMEEEIHFKKWIARKQDSTRSYDLEKKKKKEP